MKPEPSASPPGRIAELIRSYLTEHPRAADTAAGIQRWWIVPTFGEVSLWSVEQALVQLEGEGVVQKLDSSAATPTYERGPALGRATRPRDGQQ
jgi:hypothetical protein